MSQKSKFKLEAMKIVKTHKADRTIAKLARETGVSKPWLYKFAQNEIAEPGIDKTLTILETQFDFSLIPKNDSSDEQLSA